jgi:flagellar basal-body rod modification protein FlgD
MAIGNVTSTSSLLESLSIDKKNSDAAGTENGKTKLDKNAFLKLMIAQLKNQNPLEPTTNADFVAQLAQFSSVEGIEQLNTTVGQIANGNQSSQALQASSLVGRTVKVATNSGTLGSSGKVSGTVSVPTSTSGVELSVFNPSGELVFKQDLGAQKPGDVSFVWDGKNAAGQAMPAGNYRFAAVSTYDGKPLQLPTYLGANVNSVTLGANNTVTLNVQGVGPVAVGAVKEIL